MAKWSLRSYTRFVFLIHLKRGEVVKAKRNKILKNMPFLAGRKEEPRGYNYWLLYRLTELPDPSNQPGNQLISSVSLKIILMHVFM